MDIVIIFLCIGLVLVAMLWLFIYEEMKKVTKRLNKLEARINNHHLKQPKVDFDSYDYQMCKKYTGEYFDNE